MTKAEWISKVKNTLKRYDDTNQYHDKLIEVHIASVYAQLLHDAFNKDATAASFYTKEYNNSGSGITVTLDSVTNTYYSILPANIVQFSSRAEGVQQISTMRGKTALFRPISEEDRRLIESTNAGLFSDKIFYIVKEERVEYYNMTVDIASAGVMMKLIIPFTEYELTDQVHIPEGKDDMLVKTVLQNIAGIQPTNLENKNSQ